MVILVYGYDGSGPGHWQRWLETELRRRNVAVAFPELADPTQPRKEVWVAQLHEAVTNAGDEPVTFVCHSLGCWAVDHLLAEHGATGIHAALLVAPPSPHLLFEPTETFFPPAQSKQAWAPLAERTLVVGSDDDDFTSPEEFEKIAASISARFHLLPNAGHVNVASGYGPWPFALEWLKKVGAL